MNAPARAFRLGYNTSGFSRTPDLLRALDVIADSGFEAVELSFDPRHLHPDVHDASFAEEVRRRIEARGLSAACGAGGRHALGPRPHLPTWLSSDEAERRARLAFLQGAVELSARLGAKAMVLHSGPRPADAPEKDAWDRLRRGIDALIPSAARAGVTLAFEFHPAMLVRNLEGYLRLAGEFSGLGLALDVGHLRCTEEGPLGALVEKCAPWTVHAHLEDIRGRVHRHLPIGDGDIPFAEVLGAFRRTGFDGIVAAEFHSGEIPLDEPLLARRTLERLRPVI